MSTLATTTPGPWDLFKGASKVASFPTLDACVIGAQARAALLGPGTYAFSCKTAVKVSVKVVADPPAPPPPAPVYAGAATLEWDAPKWKADGLTPADIAGYVIRYGQQSGAYTARLAAVSSPATVTGLAPGVWFFAVSAVDGAGIESEAGIEQSKVIP